VRPAGYLPPDRLGPGPQNTKPPDRNHSHGLRGRPCNIEHRPRSRQTFLANRSAERAASIPGAFASLSETADRFAHFELVFALSPDSRTYWDGRFGNFTPSNTWLTMDEITGGIVQI
jgi:hypothetical protein